jgi:cytoskeletal protein RodZ
MYCAEFSTRVITTRNVTGFTSSPARNVIPIWFHDSCVCRIYPSHEIGASMTDETPTITAPSRPVKKPLSLPAKIFFALFFVLGAIGLLVNFLGTSSASSSSQTPTKIVASSSVAPVVDYSGAIIGSWTCTLNDGSSSVEIYTNDGRAIFPSSSGQSAAPYTINGDTLTINSPTGAKIISTVNIDGNQMQVKAFTVLGPDGTQQYHSDDSGKVCTKQLN